MNMFHYSSKQIITYVGAFCIFVILAIYLTYPLIWHMGDIVTGYGDEFVIAWIQNWVIHSLATNPLAIWNTNTYFPYHNTWAYSDLFIISSIFAFIPLKLIGQPIATFNFTVVSSLILLGFSLFLLCYYLTKDFLASLFCGILVICSPAVLSNNVHVQNLAIAGIPLSILSFLVFMHLKRTQYLILALSFFLLQSYNSLMPGYFLVFFYLVYCIYFWFRDKAMLTPLIVKRNLALILVTIGLLIPLLLPYYQISHEFNYVRPFRDTIHFALQPEDFIYPSSYTKLAPTLLAFSDIQHYHPASGELKPGFLGFVFTLGSLLVIFYFIKNWKKNKPIFNVLMLTALTGLVMSLGPFLHFNRATIHHPFPIPLPYAVFYYIFPGFQAFRDSERWELLFALCGAIAISMMLVAILQRFSIRQRICIYALLIAGTIFEFNFPMQFLPVTQVNQFPSIYQWLNTTPKNTSIIFMPMYNWNMQGSSIEMRREYYSTVEFRPMANGYSGFSPPPWQALIASLQKDFPNEQSVKQIQELGVQYIIIDKNQYDSDFKNHLMPVDSTKVIKTLSQNPSLKHIKTVGDYEIFAFKDYR